MKKKIAITVAAAIISFAGYSMAAETPQAPKDKGKDFDQKKPKFLCI